jgi:hypothetical protein
MILTVRRLHWIKWSIDSADYKKIKIGVIADLWSEWTNFLNLLPVVYFVTKG